MATINTAAAQHGKVRSKKLALHLDMTPMVDLAFLLLTFFMLTQVFHSSFVMPLDMPEPVTHKDHQPPIEARKVLTLVLAEGNKLYAYMADAPDKGTFSNYSSKGMRKLLTEKKAAVKGLYVLIKPAPRSNYKNLVDTFDEIDITKIDRFALVKFTDDDKALLAAAARH